MSFKKKKITRVPGPLSQKFKDGCAKTVIRLPLSPRRNGMCFFFNWNVKCLRLKYKLGSNNLLKQNQRNFTLRKKAFSKKNELKLNWNVFSLFNTFCIGCCIKCCDMIVIHLFFVFVLFYINKVLNWFETSKLTTLFPFLVIK